MDLKALLEKIDQFAGQAVGQKPGDQWRGSDKAPPGKKLVGSSESILKDLSKGKTPKSKEQELSEEYQAFLEAEFKDTVDKRPARKNARPTRGHEPLPRYKTVKADESYMSEKDIELQDYRSMTNQEFQTAYGISKTEWINQNKALVIQNPDIKRSLGINESHYKWEITFKNGKKAAYHHDSPHYSDATAASDIRSTLKSNPGATVVATKDGQPFDWESLLSEGWESGPEEYKEPYDDADDAYDRMRQDKIDTEAEKEWAKLPKVITYKLLGRGPKMEPNWDFGGTEYPSQEAAIQARAKLMADPNTPNPQHIGIQTITRVKDQANEAVDSDIVQPMGQDAFNRAGYNPIRNERDYLDTLSQLRNLELKPGLDKSMKDHITQRIRDLNAEAFKKGYIKAESRGHKIIANKLKDIERAKKFASGELKIPTPQERQAQLKQLEKAKPVKEYGANNPPQNASPAQAQQVAANLNIQKTALNQLKQINPEIDPQKAAAAMTKDTATMSPQEKEELAQVAKTVSPALGTPAFGSIKTAIQKSQVQAKK